MRSGSVAEVHCAKCGNTWHQTDAAFIDGTPCFCLAGIDRIPQLSFVAQSGALTEYFITVPHNFVMISPEQDLRYTRKSVFGYVESHLP